MSTNNGKCTTGETDIIEAEFTVQEVNPENLPSTEVKEGKLTQVDAEFEYARANIINIMQTSNKVLNDTAEMVSAIEHPSMVNAYSNLIKTLAEINTSLFDIRERKMKIKGELSDNAPITPSKISQTNVTNNTIFVGSTNELIEAMKG